MCSNTQPAFQSALLVSDCGLSSTLTAYPNSGPPTRVTVLLSQKCFCAAVQPHASSPRHACWQLSFLTWGGWGGSGFFSSVYWENLVKLLKAKLTRVGPPLMTGCLWSFNPQTGKYWTSNSSSIYSWDFPTKILVVVVRFSFALNLFLQVLIFTTIALLYSLSNCVCLYMLTFFPLNYLKVNFRHTAHYPNLCHCPASSCFLNYRSSKITTV